MKIKIMAAMLFALVTKQALASEWILISYNENAKLLIDASSIVNSGATRKAWFQLTYNKPQKSLSRKGVTSDSSKTLWVYNCAERTVSTKQSTDYLGSEVVDSYNPNYTFLQYSEITPDSFAEAGFDYVCKGK